VRPLALYLLTPHGICQAAEGLKRYIVHTASFCSPG
jgi:hypothetical protein